MKQLKFAAIVAMLALVAAPALAETQTVKVSGSLDARWLYRDNYDLRDGNDNSLTVFSGGTVPSSPNTASASKQDDAADWFMSIAQVEVAADLTDNVGVVINLFNQRDWNQDSFSDTPGSNTTEEFDLGVDLAYVQLKEAFYAPLSLVIGRQDIEFGRGLIFGNWNIQDPQASIVANEFSAVTSYDAFRATLDFEPWTVDFVSAIISQGQENDEDDRVFWWTNVNYKFSEYNAVWEAYAGLDHDRNTNSAAAAASTRSNSPEKTYVIGTRAQFDPVSNLTLGAEVATQMGDYYGGTSTASNQERDRDAWLFDVFGTYVWKENAYTPWLTLEYVQFSGDDRTSGDFEGWNGLYRSPTYGAIHDYLDTYYETALTTASGTTGPTSASNYQHFSVAGGLNPMEDLSLNATYYWFWTDEDFVVSGTNQNLGDETGTELDINVTYDYTEDVTFGLGLAWFWPGDIYDNYSTVSTTGPVNDTATQVTTNVNVAF